MVTCRIEIESGSTSGARLCGPRPALIVPWHGMILTPPAREAFTRGSDSVSLEKA